jgi:hypothetical protein
VAARAAGSGADKQRLSASRRLPHARLQPSIAVQWRERAIARQGFAVVKATVLVRAPVSKL